MGLPVQKRRRPRPDLGPVHRHHIWMASLPPVDHRRELLHRMAAGLRRDDVVGPEGGTFVRTDHLRVHGRPGRSNLLAFVLFYLIIISAAFIALIASFWNAFPGTFVATVGILFAGLLCGQLLYRVKMNVFEIGRASCRERVLT